MNQTGMERTVISESSRSHTAAQKYAIVKAAAASVAAASRPEARSARS